MTQIDLERDLDQLLRPADVKRLLQASETGLRAWITSGQLRVIRTPGNHRRFRLSDVHAITQVQDVATA